MRYKGGILRLGNEWIADEVLMEMVGATYNVDILNYPTQIKVILEDGILYGVFDLPTSLPEDLYLNIGLNAQQNEDGTLVKINWIETCSLVSHHADKEMPKVRLIN